MKPSAVCVCELCKGEASLYCVSDSAFLCWSCDAKVHEANFLVSRHVRRTVCVKCKGFDGNCISGVGFRPVRSICGSCSPDAGVDGDLDSSSSSSSVSFSDCTSSAESFVTHAPRKKILLDRRRKQKIQKIDCSSSVTELSGEFSNFRTISDEDFTKKTNTKKKKRREDALRRKRAPESIDAEAKGILVNWSRKLGLKSSCTVPLASRAFGVHLQRMTVLPFRVSLASSLWLSVKSSVGRSESTWQNLKRLEEISGVPAKVILMAESKLSRLLKMRRSRRDMEEGWAECS